VWGRSSIGGAQPFAISTDQANDIYIAGQITDNNFLAFGSDTLRNTYLRKSAFLTKYNNNGTVLWTKGIYPLGSYPYWNIIFGLTTDRCDNVWISGQMADSNGIYIDTGIILNTPPNCYDPMMFAGYNSNGLLLQYLALPTGGDDNSGLSCDTSGNIYICGDMLYVDSFLMGADTIRYSNGQENMFWGKYKPDIECSIVVSSIEGYTSFCLGIITDTLNDATPGGVWSSSNTSIATVGISTGIVTGVGVGIVTITYTVGSSYATMVDTVKLCEGGVAIVGGNNDQISIYPNPATTELNIASTDKINSVTISNLIGQVVYSQQCSSRQIQLDVADLPKGFYFVKVNNTEVRKFVKE
jgi:hypothetical protein